MLSVIIPSRLKPLPNGLGPWRYWVERAAASARHQQTDRPIEIIVGIDRDQSPPAIPGVTFVESRGAGQAAAVNAAVERANGDLIAILEDDDYWRPDKSPAQIRRLSRYDLITCDHAEVDAAGCQIGLTQFPTPSGWLMRRSTWTAVGGFNEHLRFHIDNDWLGRANEMGLRRCHLFAASNRWRVPKDLRRVSRCVHVSEPLVLRTKNPEGGMAAITSNEAAGQISRAEHAWLRLRYGATPW